MKFLSVGILTVAFIAGSFFVGQPSVATAANTKSGTLSAADKQRLKQVVDSFKRLQNSKKPSPALKAEVAKNAQWLKDHATKNPAVYQAAFKQAMAKGSLSAAQKSSVQKMVKAKGSFSGAVVDVANQVHKATNPSVSGIRPADSSDVGKIIQGIGQAIGTILPIIISLF
jgi:hypothetical protein